MELTTLSKPVAVSSAADAQTERIELTASAMATTFAFMQYIAAYMNGNNVEYKTYNDNVPGFPLTMTRKPGTRSAAHPACQPRPVTRASIHHAQPRLRGAYGTRGSSGTLIRPAAHAVRKAR